MWDILLILFLVFANGFFVAAEFALVKVRSNDLDSLVTEGRKTAVVAKKIMERLDAYLSACQLGITLASLGLGWVGEPHIATMLEPMIADFGITGAAVHYVSFPIAFSVITFLHITAGEQVPKMLAIKKSLQTSLVISLPLAMFYRAFNPFIWFLNTCSNAMLRIIGIELVSEHEETMTETELRLMLIQAAAGGEVTRREHSIMENVLDLEDIPARRYMLPRHEIVSINRNDTMEDKLRTVTESGHTRFPLCDQDLDHIIGIVHVKDIFQGILDKDELTSLVGLARDPLYLPETIKMDRLLVEFQVRQAVLAILVDEYGMASGMITLENVIEAVVGTIQDEFDSETPDIIKKGKNRYEVQASSPINLVAKGCSMQIPEEMSADTIGGIIIEILGHIPSKGEQVVVDEHVLTVLEAETTRIHRILVERQIDLEDRESEDAEVTDRDETEPPE